MTERAFHSVSHMRFDMEELNNKLNESPVWQRKLENTDYWKDRALAAISRAKYEIGNDIVNDKIDDLPDDITWKAMYDWADALIESTVGSLVD
jgi:hypothetical protein